MISGKLRREDCLLLVIDLQEKLMPVIYQNENIIKQTNILLKGMQILNVPIVVTEQYPNGLGNTCKEIELSATQSVYEKIAFSCMKDEAIKELLTRKRQVIILGVEAHICVFKTALDLLIRGIEVHIVSDAVSSRTQENKTIALQRMQQSGAFIESTEMILFQLLNTAGTDEFRAISKLIK